MADVKEFVYKDTHVTITVNQDAGKYVGVAKIEGMTPAPNQMGAASTSPDAAFESAKRRAEELIDAQASR
jgi:hypothetical protein